MQNPIQKIADIEKKTKAIEIKVETVAKDGKKNETVMEYRTMQAHLRLRGIEEQLNEDIRFKVIGILAEFFTRTTR